jgi:hypothetical protein
VTRWRRGIALAVVIALALAVAGCSSDDGGDKPQAKPTTSDAPSGGGGTTPPSAGQLPPKFMKCMADQGYPIESPDEVHSAPTQVLQACFGALHGGGGGP